MHPVGKYRLSAASTDTPAVLVLSPNTPAGDSAPPLRHPARSSAFIQNGVNSSVSCETVLSDRHCLHNPMKKDTVLKPGSTQGWWGGG